MKEDDLEAFSIGNNNNVPDNLSKEIETLNEENIKLNKNIKTERFVWILSLIIVFDSSYFMSSESWGAPVVIGILEIIVILVFSDMLEIKTITGIVDRLFGLFGSNKNRDI